MTLSIVPTTSTDSEVPHGASHAMSQRLDVAENTFDDESDYGDFTVDEQEIIHELLARIAPGNTAPEEPLELTDIEDYEEPKGVRLPKTLGKEQWVPPWMQQQPEAQDKTQIRVEDQTSRDHRATSNGEKVSSITVAPR